MADEQLYAQAVGEFKAGKRDAALFAKAYALARGDEKAQEFEYIKLRVAQLRKSQIATGAKQMAGAAAVKAQHWWPKVKTAALWLVGVWAALLVLSIAVGLAVK